MAPNGRRPSDQANDPGCESACRPVGCQKPHPPSPFIVITHPESWYSFYHPAEGRRLSRSRYCSKGVQPMLKAVYRSGVYDKHATAHGGIQTLVLSHCSQAHYRWTTATSHYCFHIVFILLTCSSCILQKCVWMSCTSESVRSCSDVMLSNIVSEMLLCPNVVKCNSRHVKFCDIWLKLKTLEISMPAWGLNNYYQLGTKIYWWFCVEVMLQNISEVR